MVAAKIQACYDAATITGLNVFIVQAPGAYPRVEHLEYFIALAQVLIGQNKREENRR